MPSRVIRGEILSSETLSMLSRDAQFLFWRMILGADDYGRLDGRLPALKAALYPMDADVGEGHIAAWVHELSGLDDPPVRLYEAAGRPYVALVNWERHRGKGRRAQASKYPDQPEHPGNTKEVNESPGDPRRSADLRGDPPEGRGTRDEGRRTGDVYTAPQEGTVSPPTGGSLGPAPRRKARGTPFPDPFPVEALTRLELWSHLPKQVSEFGPIDLEWAIDRVKAWAEGGGHLRADWASVVQGAIRDGWGRPPAQRAASAAASKENPHAQSASQLLDRIASQEAQGPGGPLLDLPKGEHGPDGDGGLHPRLLGGAP